MVAEDLLSFQQSPGILLRIREYVFSRYYYWDELMHLENAALDRASQSQCISLFLNSDPDLYTSCVDEENVGSKYVRN